MLHTEAVESGTFSLLNKLMALSTLQRFSLVGGTALALRYGHRSSEDLDLFCCEPFEHAPVIDELEKAFGAGFQYKKQFNRFGIFCFIDSVKVDLVYYPHKQIGPGEVVSDIRMYLPDDIAAMKIQAILGRGKKKDFWDIFELFQHYSLQQIMEWHKLKFPDQILAISIPYALTYFADADETEDPVSFKGQTWIKVKKGIQKVVRDYLS